MQTAAHASLWSRPWLITTWTLNLVAVILVYTYSVSFYLHVQFYYQLLVPSQYFRYRNYDASFALVVVYIVANTVTFVLNFTSAILYARGNLSPLYMLVSNSIQSAAWFIILIASAVTPPGLHILALTGNCILIMTSVGLLLYSVALFRRQRKQRGVAVEEEKGTTGLNTTGQIPASAPAGLHPAGLAPSYAVATALDDDDSGFEVPAPDYETVVGGNGGVAGDGMPKYNDA